MLLPLPAAVQDCRLDCQFVRGERGEELVGVECFAGRDCSDSLGRTVEDLFGRFADKRRRDLSGT
jgi:hypothetical protein